MGMIQGIDGNALIQAARQGTQDGFAIRSKQAAMAKQQALSGLDGQLFNRGVAGQGFASSNPQANVQGGGVAGQVPGAFNPGGSPPMGAPQAPTAPQAPSAYMMDNVNQDALQRRMAIDPEGTKQLMEAMQGWDAKRLDFEKYKIGIIGSAAFDIDQGHTPEERQARFEHAVPQLLRVGVQPEILQHVAGNLSPQAMAGFQSLAIDTSKLIDQQLARQEFMAGKTVPVTAGGNVALVKPVIGQDGSVSTDARYLVGGQEGAQAPPPVHVKSVAEAHSLPPGTKFYDTNGVLRQVPGGGVSNGTGGF